MRDMVWLTCKWLTLRVKSEMTDTLVVKNLNNLNSYIRLLHKNCYYTLNVVTCNKIIVNKIIVFV